MWRAQFLPLFCLHGYLQYVDGSYPCLTPTITNANNTMIDNSDHTTWHYQDQLILDCILSTFTKSVFSHIVGLETSHDV